MILKNKYGTAILACVLALMPVYASFSFASSADELRTKLTEIEQKKRDAEVRRADAERERRAKIEIFEVIFLQIRSFCET